jgi:hypothetical protein
VKSQPFHRGIGHVVFRVSVVPPDWGSRGRFSAYVNLGPRDPQPRFAPWVSDTKVIDVVP